jgi:hypothetical protein
MIPGIKVDRGAKADCVEKVGFWWFKANFSSSRLFNLLF